jgi:hypothetical protein
MEMQESVHGYQAPAAKPLDEARWEAWKEKGRAQDRKRHLAQVIVVRCVALGILLTAAVLGSRLAPYELLVRSAVFASLLALTWQAVRARQLALAAAFGLVAMLYTPIAPAFHFASGWDRAFLAASSIPLVAFLVWRNAQEPRYV